MADYNNLDKGNQDGTVVALATATKVGFYGIAPVNQPDALTTTVTAFTWVSATAATTAINICVTAGYGFLITDEAQSFLLTVQNVQARINDINTRLVETGLIAGGTSVAVSTSGQYYDYHGNMAPDGVKIGASTTSLVSFWGVVPCDQAAVLTTQLGTITITVSAAEVSATIAAMVSNSVGFGFANLEQGRSFLNTLSNLQTRAAEVETALAAAGIIGGGTTITASTSYDYISKGNDDGTIIGPYSTSKVGFWGVTPVDQPAAITAAVTTIIVTAPGTTDYAFDDLLATIATFKFATSANAQACLSVVQNCQRRMTDLEARLVELGILASA